MYKLYLLSKSINTVLGAEEPVGVATSRWFFSLEVQTVHRLQQPHIHHSKVSDSQSKNVSLGVCDSFQTKHYDRLYFSFLIVKPEQQIQLECSNSKKKKKKKKASVVEYL